MDFSSIAKLLPEFLEMLKNNGDSVQEDLASQGGAGMLQNLLSKGEKYTKYLPLLPLFSRFSKDGLKGLLKNSDDVGALLNLVSQSDNKYAKMLKNIEAENLVKFLPLISEFFEKKQQPKEILPVSAPLPVQPKKVYTLTPLAAIAEIADKDIIYALNLHISKNT